MAKSTATTQVKPSSNTNPLVPISSDPRTEMVFLLGKAGFECTPRMAERMYELFVILTAPPVAEVSE